MYHEGVLYPTVLVFGDRADRVIETVGMATPYGEYELGYYDGDNKPKAIINISPALGCPVGCNFCELQDRKGRVLSASEMFHQVTAMRRMVECVDGNVLDTKPLKINIAKTGDPAFNPNMIEAFRKIQSAYPGTSFKYSTVMPALKLLPDTMTRLASFAANEAQGSMQLQISLISTNERYRQGSARARLASLHDVRVAVDAWHAANPNGRVPNCSLLLGADTPCDPAEIQDILPPGLVNFRVRPIVTTEHSQQNGIQAVSRERIEAVMAAFRDAGYAINDAGVPSPVEREAGLASNVTRHRLLTSGFPKKGFIYANAP